MPEHKMRKPLELPIVFQGELGPHETRTLRCDVDPPVGFVGHRVAVPVAGFRDRDSDAPAADPEKFVIEAIVAAGRNQLTTAFPASAAAFVYGPTLPSPMDATTQEAPGVKLVVTNLEGHLAYFVGAIIGQLPKTAGSSD